ncbi:MAG: hypothetical protein ACYC6F_07790 [Longimicrobiales bacterium]
MVAHERLHHRLGDGRGRLGPTWPVALSPRARPTASTTMSWAMAAFWTMVNPYLPVKSLVTSIQISWPPWSNL